MDRPSARPTATANIAGRRSVLLACLLLTSLAVGRRAPALGGDLMAASGAPATGAVTFRVTVDGKAHDSGAITVPAGRVTDAISGVDFNGCVVVKNKVTGPPFGAYTFEIHVNYMGGDQHDARGRHAPRETGSGPGAL